LIYSETTRGQTPLPSGRTPQLGWRDRKIADAL